MNAKHYVSLEAAKKLKELGYHDEYQVHYYNDKGEVITPWCSDDDDENLHFPRPTLLEAMDWLEDKGIIFEFRFLLSAGLPMYYCPICKDGDTNNPIYITLEDGTPKLYTDRNECMQKAIEKALELL